MHLKKIQKFDWTHAYIVVLTQHYIQEIQK